MTANMPDEKILDRIKKLHAKAVSAKEIGSEAEALTFMAAVEMMLAKYDMEISDVEFQLALTKDPVKMILADEADFADKTSKTRDAVQRLVAASIARLFHCETIGDSYLKRGFWIIGRKEHREVAHFMCVTILRLMDTMATEHYVRYFHECRRRGNVGAARGYREAFRQGFAVAIAERCRTLVVEREATARGQGTALVRLDKERQMIKDFLTNLEKTGGMSIVQHQGPKGTSNSRGSNDGNREGTKVSLTANAVKPVATTHKRLGAGNG